MKYIVSFESHMQTFTNMNNLTIKKDNQKHNSTGVLHNGATLREKLRTMGYTNLTCYI